MNPMKVLFLYIALSSLLACGGGSTSTSNNVSSTPVVNTTSSSTTASSSQSVSSYQGVIQKGPFSVGSNVTVSLLDLVGKVTNNSIRTTVNDKSGSFLYDIPGSWSVGNDSFFEISSQGQFYNESTGQPSTQTITLTAITNNLDNSSVNLLTHWASYRIRTLLNDGDINNNNINQTYTQANNELSTLFGGSSSNRLDFSKVDQSAESSALLLLLSGALMTVAEQTSQDIRNVIDKISTDFSADGELNGEGSFLFRRMQALIRDNPQKYIDNFSENLNQGLGFRGVSSENLPEIIPLASRPVAILPTEILAEPGETIVLDGSESHDSGDLVNFTWFRVDQQTQFAVPLSDRFSDKPSITVPNQESELLFALVVTDVEDLTDTNVIKVIVREPPPENKVPIAISQKVTLNEDETIDIVLTGTDEDGDDLTFNLDDFIPLPNGFLNRIAPNKFTYIPRQNFNGSESFQFTVSDESETSEPATVDIEVNPVNDRPVAVVGPNQEITLGTSAITLSLDGRSSFDIDGSLASFVWREPIGFPGILDRTNLMQPSFVVPNVSTETILIFSLVVVDNDGANSLEEFSLVTIKPSSVVVIPPIAVAEIDGVVPFNEGSTVQLQGDNSTPDGDIETFVWEQLGATASTTVSFNENVPNPSFIAPEVGTTPVTLSFRLTVTNDSGTDSQTVEVPINGIPEAVAEVDGTAPFDEGTTVELIGDNSTDDGSVDSYSWEQVGSTDSTAVNLVGPATANPSFTAPDIDLPISSPVVLQFKLTVTDDNGVSVSPTSVSTVNVAINAIPEAIVEIIGEEEETTITLDGSDSLDDGTITSYEWEQIAGSPTITFNEDMSGNDVSSPTFIAPEIDPHTHNTAGEVDPNVLTFKLTVTDNNGASSSVEVDATIIDVNKPPEIEDYTCYLNSNSLHTIDLKSFNFYDPDGDDVGGYSIVGALSESPIKFLEVNDPPLTFFVNGVLTAEPQVIGTTSNSFDYKVEDQHGEESNTATVDVFVLDTGF